MVPAQAISSIIALDLMLVANVTHPLHSSEFALEVRHAWSGGRCGKVNESRPTYREHVQQRDLGACAR